MSLWGDEFTVKKQPVKKTIKKVSTPKKVTSVTKLNSKNITLSDRLTIIREDVYRILGRYKQNTQVIRTIEELHDYIDYAIKNGEISIDTETNNSIEPITCKLMGPCIYTPGQKNAYIPINHVDPNTLEKLPNQLTEEDIKNEFSRLTDTKIIMHNGKFDYQVIKCTCGLPLSVYWDTMLAARLLNENELAGLKPQYKQKIDSSIEKYSIEHLFKNVEYAVVDPDLFALYAATDAYMTYELYKWQLEQFNKPEHNKLKDLFFNVEMPVLEVAAEMELTGVKIDTDYAEKLSVKYHKLLQDVQLKIDEQLEYYRPAIEEWRKTAEANFHPTSKKPDKNGNYKQQKSKNEQLKNPPELTSPTQLAILLYDVLKTPSVDIQMPRGTGEDILKKIKLPLCELVLQQRGLEKLLSTYIDKLPKCVCEKDGRLHAHFNQLGTDTGRFSSTDPNLQNIPSHNKEIRLMFTASDGCVMVGSDFSQQEPRLCAEYAHDEKMVGAYMNNKDLYATVAQSVYKNSYEDNLEHYADGKLNVSGAKRRGDCKSILLGLLYGRGPSSIAEQIKGTTQDAQKIIDDFYIGFPKVKKWMDDSLTVCRKLGYVEDFWGRRRRLPDINLPKYTLSEINEKKVSTDNPLLYAKGLVKKQGNPLIQKYEQLLNTARGKKDVKTIRINALQEGINVRDNGAFISQAERQCVNARIQGGAATMSKLAMINVYHNQQLRELGFKMLLQVHDELIGECPKENAEKVAEILSEVMKHSAEPVVSIPFKCDAEISPCWYYYNLIDNIKKEIEQLVEEQGMLLNDATQKIAEQHCEFTREEFMRMIS